MPKLTRREFMDLSLQASIGAGLVTLPGCGSGTPGSVNPPPPPPPPPPGDLITPAARATAVKSVSSQFATLPHSSVADDNQRLLTFFRSDAAFAAAGTQAAGSVWARFTDGTPLVVVNDGSVTANTSVTLPTRLQSRTTASRVSRRLTTAAPAATPTELPSGRNLFLYNNLGFAAELATPAGLRDGLLDMVVDLALSDLEARLDSVGYAVTKRDGTVSALRGVSNADLLYMYAHLGLFFSSTGTITAGISTATPVLDSEGSGVNLASYNDLLQDIKTGDVGFMMYIDFETGPLVPNPILKPYYMITPSFIAKYMRFTDRSLVFLNGCLGFSEALGNLTNAFGAANAGVYAGWSLPVDAAESLISGHFLLQGMAGLLGATSGPPIRPFSYPAMLEYMRSRTRGGGYGLDQSQGIAGVSTLNILPLKSGAVVGLLAPSIALLAPQEDVLTIFGSFGSVAGTVTIGGQSVVVQDWQAGRILCSLPAADKSGGAGVVVVTVNGLVSNPVSLTAWKVTFQYTATYDSSGASDQYDTLSGSYTLSATLEAWLRADIHKGRAAPGDTPPSASIIPSLNALSWPTKMAKLTAYSISGTITHTVHTGDPSMPVDKTVIESTTPDGSSPYPYDSTNSMIPQQQSAFSLISRVVDAGTGTLKFFLRAVLPTYSTTLSDTSVLGVAAFSGILSSRGLGPGGDGTITMSFNSSGSIAGGSATPGPNGETLTWQGASPAAGSGPDPNAPS